MKKVILGISLLFLMGSGIYAADLEATTVETDPFENTGEIDLILNGGAAPYIFSWTGPGGFTSTDEDLTGLAAGTYTVTVTDAYCGTATLEVVVEEGEVNNASVIEEKEFSVSIYPNPSNGVLFFKSDQVLDVEIYTIVGERVFAGKNVKQVDLSNQASGIYLVKVNSELGSTTRKITLNEFLTLI